MEREHSIRESDRAVNTSVRGPGELLEQMAGARTGAIAARLTFILPEDIAMQSSPHPKNSPIDRLFLPYFEPKHALFCPIASIPATIAAVSSHPQRTCTAKTGPQPGPRSFVLPPANPPRPRLKKFLAPFCR